MTRTVLRLRALRLSRGLSQVELGRRAKVRQATISGLESGKAQRVDLGILDRLAAALGVRAPALLEWVPARKAAKGAGKTRRTRRP